MSENNLESSKIIEATLELRSVSSGQPIIKDPVSLEQIDQKLDFVNNELDQYINKSDRIDYALAVASGILAGVVDSFYTGEFSLEEAHSWGSEKTEKFIEKVAKLHKDYKGDNPKDAIVFLAEKVSHDDPNTKNGYHMVSDTLMSEFGGTRQHHLRDFAHHASLMGWAFSLLTQFTRKCYGTNTAGAFIVEKVKDETFIGKDVPQKILFGTVYWFFHLLSDVAGSGDPNSEGTGIPGPLLSAAKMLSSTPLFNQAVNKQGNREFSVFISKLFNGSYYGYRDENGKLIPLRFDFRTELGILRYVGKMTVPVIINETLVRTFYFIRQLIMQIQDKGISSFSELDQIDWDSVKPAGNRTIDRMLTVSSLTFTVADTADAAVRAAIDSAGNWVVFSGRFVSRINFVGAGRAAIAVAKEISNEQKEAQLIHEKRLLTEAKTAFVVGQLQEYKAALEERVSNYLAEDIQSFMEGFDYMDQGIVSGDSDLVIKGNVVIQKVLGREPQFTTQEEFDELMDSDIPLQL